MRARLALSALALSACAIQRSPPVVGRIGVHVASDSLTLELDKLVNTASSSIEICLENIVVMSSIGEGAPSCTFPYAGPCYVVPRKTPATIAFKAPTTCPGLDPKTTLVLLDLQWRPWPPQDGWITMTLFGTP